LGNNVGRIENSFTFGYSIKQSHIMTIISNTTGTKAVNITTDGTGAVRAMYVQVYSGEQQVLQSKSFASVKNAEKWANRILN